MILENPEKGQNNTKGHELCFGAIAKKWQANLCF